MLALIIAVALLVLGFFLVNTYDFEGLGVILILIGLMGTIPLTIIKGCSAFEYEEDLIERNILQEQLDVSKERDTLMDATLTLKIVELNASIEKQQYYNETVWGWYVDDRYMTLEPVE